MVMTNEVTITSSSSRKRCDSPYPCICITCATDTSSIPGSVQSSTDRSRGRSRSSTSASVCCSSYSSSPCESSRSSQINESTTKSSSPMRVNPLMSFSIAYLSKHFAISTFRRIIAFPRAVRPSFAVCRKFGLYRNTTRNSWTEFVLAAYCTSVKPFPSIASIAVASCSSSMRTTWSARYRHVPAASWAGVTP
uniref:Uncharacterized protein n=1 Tax=Anopheles merus TaxID=30066 RepID=A0A182VCY4_ANOME